MSSRTRLRAVVWELSGGLCEHPVLVAGPDGHRHAPCHHPAVELAHIVPRGMGHTGYRDMLGNVMAACDVHARSTDDLSHEAWLAVPAPHDRRALATWVEELRRQRGWDV